MVKIKNVNLFFKSNIKKLIQLLYKQIDFV
jgi:hypothetical protein